MKKSISIFLLLCMLIGMFGGVSAFATEGEETAEVVEVEETVGEEAAEENIEEPEAVEEVPAEEAVEEELVATEEEFVAEAEAAAEAHGNDGAAEEVAEFSEDGTGTELWVSANGNDSYAGTGSTVPLKTLNAAFAKISADQTVTIHIMTDIAMDAQVNFSANNANVTLDSDDGNAATSGDSFKIYPSVSYYNNYSGTAMISSSGSKTLTFRNVTLDGRVNGNSATQKIGRGIYGTNNVNLVFASGAVVQNFAVPVTGGGTAPVEVQQYCIVKVESGARFTGNTIAAGKSTYNTNANSVLCIGWGGTLYMTGGEITGNTCLGPATGMINLGTNVNAYLSGGSISGNTMYKDNSYACYKRMSSATSCINSYYYFSGSIKVWDNLDTNGYQKNIFTPAGAVVYLNGALTSDAKIGVYTDQTPSANLLVAYGYPSYTAVASDAQHIMADRASNFYVTFNSSDNKIYLSPHTHTWQYSASGNTLTATCSQQSTCGKEPVTVTLTASTPVTYTGSAYTGAQISGTTDWKNAIGSVPTIHYVGRGSTTYEDSTTAPTDAGTYTAQITAGSVTATADFEITKKQLTVSGSTATKVYDGNTTATITVGTVSGKCGTDDVTVTASGSYSSADVGNAYTIAATYTLSGTKANNYIVPVAENITNASITAKQLTVSVPTVADKVYDGTDTATATVGTVDGKISGDDVAVEVDSATFAGALAASEKDVTVSYKLSGTKANNYIAPDEDTVKAAITPKSIQLTANSKSKTYDGRALSDGGYTITDGEPAAGDTLTVTVKGEISEVGSADNKIVSYTIKNADQTDVTACYSVQTVSGKLVVQPDEKADVRVDSEKLNEVVEKFKEKYKEDYTQEDILSVILKTDGDIPQKDTQMIREKAGDKQIVFANAELWLAVNGELKKNIGDENETLIDVAYSFNFTGKENVQVFRVHNDKVDELTEDPNDAGEYVSFDKANKTITVTAMKYSTYAITYTVPQTKAQAPGTGDNNALGLWLGLASMSVIALGAALTAKKRRS